MARRPVKPLPIPMRTRSGPAVCTSVVIAEAVTIGWRRLGISTPGPSTIRSVRSAAWFRTIQTSGYSAGES